jgi:dienelactone hydrolase
MNLRRILLAAVAALAMLAGTLPGAAAAAPAHRADGDLSEWQGAPTMLSGETRVSKGELIYDDWLYDDYGADLDHASNQPAFRSNLAPTRGDYRYPTNAARYGYNAADIRELRVAADGAGLHLLVFLQTMKVRDAAAVTLAIDSQRDLADADQWPDGVGIDGPPADHFITSWGTGGVVTDGRGHRSRIRRQAVNLDDNALEIDVPWKQLGQIRGRNARLYFVSGLADASAQRYMQPQTGQATATAAGGGQAGSTAVFDAGFDANEVSTRAIGSHWGEEVQSAALAQKDLPEFGERVELGELEARVSDGYAPQNGHFYDRIFRSSQDFGEGIVLKNDPSNPGGTPDPQFLSRYQPYGLYIPADYQPGTPTPLLLNGHSLDVNQNEYAVVSPNLFNQLGDQRSSFVITPLARGTDTWYINSGFKDVLEAWENLQAHYSIDDDRTSIGGYSMGGYMTYRMGLLMPDRFTAAVPYVGPPAYQLWAYPSPPQPSGQFSFVGQTNNIITNALDLPYEINNAGADELVPASGARQQAQTFTDLGRPHIFYFYPSSDHLALIAADEWGHSRDFLDDHAVRNLSPIELAYRRYPAMDLPQYGLRFDGAYWVDGMSVRGTGVEGCTPGSACQTTFGQVDAVTYAFGGNRTVPENFQSAYPGPPFPADVTGTNRVPGNPIPQKNGFEATLQNLSAIAFDTGRAGLDTASKIHAKLTGTGDVAVTLRGSFGAVTATFDGQPVTVEHVADGIRVNLTLSGEKELVVTP